jgi:hypothetical protein
LPASSKVRALRFGGAHGVSLTALGRRALPAALVALALAAPAAQAEEVFTSQAAAARATDSTWIPAPPKPAAVCIVDTGNDPNPDTTNVIARLSVDGGDGSDLDTTGHHGTLMSMIASAPYNGFGMVGVAPSVKVVSVRATRPGNGGGFAFSDVLAAITLCRKNQEVFNIKTISLSLGVRNDGPLEPTVQQAMAEVVDRAREVGLSVVAAAGNHAGPVDYPAAYEPVVAVAASDKSGSRCAFAAAGAGLDVWAPGCPQDVALHDGRAAWASGSSQSTVLVAAVLAEMRGLRPELTVDRSEALLISASRASPAGPALDAAAAFQHAGLDAELAQGRAAAPVLETDQTDGSDPSRIEVATAGGNTSAPGLLATTDVQAPSSVVAVPDVTLRRSEARSSPRLPRPRVKSFQVRPGAVALVLRNRPPGADAKVSLYVRRPRQSFPSLARRALVVGDRFRTRLLGTLSELSITYSDPKKKRGTSTTLTLRP